MALVLFVPALEGGVVYGVVTFTDGAAAPAVNVTLTPAAGGTARTVSTSDDGTYTIPDVPVGSYRMTVSLNGFRTETIDIVVQQIDQVLSPNVILRSASTTERITVTAGVDSFGNVTSPHVGVSEGPSFLTLFGQFPFTQLVLNDGLDPNLGNVKVLVTNGQTELETDIYYGATNQMAVRTPIGFDERPGWTIKVCELSVCSDPYRLNVGRHAPFVAAISGNGIGDAAAQDGTFNLITFLNAMKDVGVLWINGKVEPGSVGKVFLNGQEQKTLYYGDSGLDGLTQFNIQIDPNTLPGHVTGFVEEMFNDGTRRISQPFNTWVATGAPLQDHFLGNLAPQVYGAGGLDLAEALFRQTHQVRLNERGDPIVDLNVFVADVNLRNLNSRTYNSVTPGNPQSFVVPFGYTDPRQDLPFNGTVAVNIPNFTQFTMATANNSNLLQIFTDPAGRTFQGPVTVILSGTIGGSASNVTLQGNYERQSAAIDLLEQAFLTSRNSLLNEYPSGVWESFRTAEAQMMGNEEVLFFAGESLNCDRFGSVRSELWMTRNQVGDLPGASLAERVALYQELQGLYEEAMGDLPCISTFSWGILSWDAAPLTDPFDFGSQSYQRTWLVEKPRPPGGQN
jgi:hypothetical protein